MTPRWIILPVLLCLLLISSASSQTVTAEGVSAYSMVADDGMVIYQVTVNDLPIGSSQTHTLTSGAGTYLLTISTYKDLGWNNADISLTTPNGSVQTAHASALGILAGDYKTDIQYVYPQAYSGTTYTTVSLVLGLTPVTATFNGGAMGWDPSTSIAFNAVSGNLGGTTTVYVEEMTKTDFQNNVVNYNPTYGIGNLGSQIFQWSWSAVLGFLNMIPVIGPVAVGIIGVMGSILTSAYFWLHFIALNFSAILCGVECLILMMAGINAGTGKNSFKKLASNIYQYNIAFVGGLIFVTGTILHWVLEIVSTVASVVQGLKPL